MEVGITEYQEKMLKLSNENKITDDEFFLIMGLDMCNKQGTDIKIMAKMLDLTILRLKQQNKYSEIFKEEFGRAVRRFRKTNLVKVFKVKEGKRSFHLNDIISIESYYNTTFIRTTKGVHITNYENLRRIRREVLDYDFVRVQAGFIVNMNYIASIRYRGVELMTGQVLAVSIKNFRVVMEKYEKFIHSKEY